MHDEDIGKICSICKRRDYIPYECAKCRKKVPPKLLLGTHKIM
jgi:primosomal protein N'